uniref:Uncharacterized protein n=1 Tax=Oryza barthii TaxID=65489 RepID=A0A0D3EL22_9ORYZ
MTSPPPIHHEQTPHHVPDYQLAPPLPSRLETDGACMPVQQISPALRQKREKLQTFQQEEEKNERKNKNACKRNLHELPADRCCRKSPPLAEAAHACRSPPPYTPSGRSVRKQQPDTAVARARNARRSLMVDNNSLRRYLEYLPSTVKDLYNVQASAVCR